MNCNEVMDKLSLYIDRELSDDEIHLMEEHIKDCENCQKELEEYNNLISILQNLPEEEPPEGYCQRLHNKLKEANASQSKNLKINKFNRFKWMKYGSIAAALVLVFLVYGLNNLGLRTKNEAYDMAQPSESMIFPEVAPEVMESYDDVMSGEGGQSFAASDARAKISLDQREMKIIKSGSIYAQTEDYHKFFDDLSLKITSLGGLLESNNTEVYQRYNDKKLMYGNLKIRVPQENFYEMIGFIESSAEVRRKNINEIYMTKEYYEKDNKVKNLEIQEQHLRELFEKATTVEEMLLIENELRRIRTEIDGLNMSLKDIDDRASMSTINLEIEEVMPVSLTLKSQRSVLERSKEGFINTINSIVRTSEDLLVKIVSSSPILVPVIIIAVVVFLKIKKYINR